MSQAQREKAKRARWMHQAIGTPTTSDLSAMIRMNLIKDNEVTSGDTVLAEEAYGEDIRSCKGKSARLKPKAAISNRITLPKELMNVNCEVTLSIDGMTINGSQFLTSISHDIFCRTAQLLPKRPKSEDHKVKLKELNDICKRGDFTIKEIHAEQQFRKALDRFCHQFQPPIKINLANAKEHVPRAERNMRVIEKRARAAYHQLPCKHLPKILLEHTV